MVSVIETDSISGHSGVPINISQREAAISAAAECKLNRIVVVHLDNTLDGLDVSIACSEFEPGAKEFINKLWKLQSESRQKQSAQV